jgi:hypothetical protein
MVKLADTRGKAMGKSRQNDDFERGMHRSEDDLGYLDPDMSDDMMGLTRFDGQGRCVDRQATLRAVNGRTLALFS